MQTLLWILLTNLFTGTVLYLVLSLKLEKSADEFRIKKLRREMDETIREFNATAERNISLLENRIRTAKSVLNDGQPVSFDSLYPGTISFDSSRMPATSLSSDTSAPNKGTVAHKPFNVLVNEPLDLSSDESILDEGEHDESGASDEELKIRYAAASSKHEFIASLYRDGRTVDELVRVSGLSHKELTLILQLNGLKAEGL